MTAERSVADIYGREFPAGAVIFEEGDPGSRIFVIQSGQVRILKRTGGRSVTLARLGPGEFFGEMALLDRLPRSASAVVDEPARILELDEAAFEKIVKERGEVALRILKRLSRRLREANRQIRNFLSADTECRAVSLLRALAGPAGPDGFRPIPPDLDAAHLAQRAGAPSDAGALWRRLQRVRLVREVGERAQLAPEEVVAEYLRYAELKPRFVALVATELSEAGDLEVEQAPGVVAELLNARLLPEGRLGRAPGLAADYAAYLELKRRFESGGVTDMRVACPNCSAAFQIDDRRIPPGGVNVRCTRCQQPFPVKPASEQAPSAVPLPAPGGAPGAVPLPPPSAAAPPLPRASVPLPAPRAAAPRPPPLAGDPGAVPLPSPAPGRVGAVPLPPPATAGANPYAEAFAASGTPFASDETPFAAAPEPAPAEPALAEPPPFAGGSLPFAPQEPLPSAPDGPPAAFGEVDLGGSGPPPTPPQHDPFSVPPPEDDPFARVEPPPPPPRPPAPPAPPAPAGEELENLYDAGEQRPAATSEQADDGVGYKVRRRSGKVFGPFPAHQVVEMLGKGELLGNEDVSEDGGASWTPIGTVTAFGEAMRDLTATPEDMAAPVAGRPAPPPEAPGVPFGDRMAAAKVTEAAAAPSRLAQALALLPKVPGGPRVLAGAAALVLVLLIGVAGAFTRHGWFFYKVFRGRADAARVAGLVGSARAGLAVDDFPSVRSALTSAGQAVQADDDDLPALAAWAAAVAALDRRHAALPDQLTQLRALAVRLAKEADGQPHTLLVQAAAAGLEGAGGQAAEGALEKARWKGPPDPEALALLGLRALDRGDPGRAAGFYAQLEAAQPTSARAALGLAQVAIRRGELEGARGQLQKALVRSPAHPLALLEQAVLDEQAGTLEAARVQVDALLAKEAEGKLAPRERARALTLSAALFGHHAADAAKAEEAFEAAVAADPKLTEPRLAMAAYRLRRGDPLRAVAALEPLQASAASDPAVAELLIRGLAAAGRALDATQLADAAMAKAQGDPRLLMARGAIREQAGEVEPAAALYQQALDRAPGDVRPRLALARLALASKDLARSSAQLAILIEKAPRDPAVQTLLGDLRVAEGKSAEAEKAYQAALQLDPEFAGADLGLAQLAQARGDIAAAQLSLGRALAVEPRNARGHGALGALQWRTGDLAAAEKSLATAVSLLPGEALFHVRLGAVRLERGDLAGAFPEIENGSNLALHLSEGHHWLGRALMAKGEMPGAMTQLKRSVEMEPTNAVYLLHLGLAQERVNSLGDAIESFKAAAAANPKYPDPQERLGLLYATNGRCDLAAPAYEKALVAAPGVSRYKLALADCRLKTRKGAEAVKLYHEVMKEDPAAVQVYYKLARALHETKGKAAALPWYERAAKEEKDNPMPHYYLGYAFKEQGARGKAIQEFKAYLAIRPDAEDKDDIAREIEYLGGTP